LVVKLIHCDVEEVDVGPQDWSQDFGARGTVPAFDPFIFKLVFGFCIYILFIYLNEQGDGKDIAVCRYVSRAMVCIANDVRQVHTTVPV
jgi:hypothetical protein